MVKNFAEANEVWMGPLPERSDGGLDRPRVGIAGMSIESSTFSPHISGDEAFTIRRGAALRAFYPFLDEGRELGDIAEWLPLTHARALPGGAVAASTYHRVKEEIVRGIRENGPFDGFYLDIHGAMSVVGMTDAEGDLARAIREALGDDALVSASMDLHGNVSAALRDAVDLLTCYRMAPHEDWLNTKERAVWNLLSLLRGAHGADPLGRRPYQAWVPVPVLLPGEKTSTRVEPARSLYAALPAIAAQDGVIDASVWVGYAWADEPRCQAYVVVVGDDRELIGREARDLAHRYWDARDEFDFVGTATTLDQAIADAIRQDAARPFVISDSGDNPTAGGAGDVTSTLSTLLTSRALSASGRSVIVASIFDAAAVGRCVEAGIGGAVDVRAGAQVDDGPSGPVRLRGTVSSITDGDEVAGRQAVVDVGSVHVIITERRKPFHRLDDFRMLGLDPEATDILVVKIGYLEPELHELAADWRLALTPGGVDQDLLRLGHHHLARGVHPFEKDHVPSLQPVITRRGEEPAP